MLKNASKTAKPQISQKTKRVIRIDLGTSTQGSRWDEAKAKIIKLLAATPGMTRNQLMDIIKIGYPTLDKILSGPEFTFISGRGNIKRYELIS